jgi:hypothetical protein
VPLVRPDAGAGLVEGEAPLVVPGDDLVEFGPAQRRPVPPERVERHVHVHPAARVQFDADPAGCVP